MKTRADVLNQITNAAFIGTVGIDWQFSGVGNFSGNPGETDLLLRNSTTGGLVALTISLKLSTIGLMRSIDRLGTSRGGR